VTGAIGAAAALPPPRDPRAAFRLTTAARQDLWRSLSRARGCAPVVRLRWFEDRAEIAAWAVALDFAPAAPRAVDALGEIFQDKRIRGWTAWAARAKPVRKGQ
jgi:hypothetical protein